MLSNEERVGGRTIKAHVEDIAALDSPVTVTTHKHTVTFDGNDFGAKHLRRLSRDSMKLLSSSKQEVSGEKFNALVKEGHGRADERFRQAGDPEGARNTTVFLDIAGFCQLGGQISIAIDDNSWTAFRNQVGRQQQHVVVTLSQVLVMSANGFGQPEAASSGIGAELTVTVEKGIGNQIRVVHLAAAIVVNNFGYSPGIQDGKPIVFALKRARELAHQVAGV
jgi:hypothetical protein